MRLPEPDPSSPNVLPGDTLSEEVFDRYFAGECTPAEAVTVRAYLDAHYPGVEPSLARPAATYLSGSDQTASTDTNVLWEAVVERIAARAFDETNSDPQGANRQIAIGARAQNELVASPLTSWTVPKALTRLTRARQWAGGLLLLVVVPALMYIAGTRVTSHADAAEFRTVVAKMGQRVNYHFPDGSSAVLAPGTTLQYSADFGKTAREIVIDGEALFTVTQNEGVPFLVRSHGVTVRVLGTTFSVRRFVNDTSVKVVVAQGKVSVAAHILTSGDAATVNAGGTVQLARGVDIAPALSWTTGRLSFHRTSLRDVIPEFERWYGVSVSVTDSGLLDRPLTATFLINEPDGALASLASLLRVPMTRSGDHVMFGQPE